LTNPSSQSELLAPWQRLPRRTLAIALSVLPLVALANVGVLVWSLGGRNLLGVIAAPGLIVLAAAIALAPMLLNAARIGIWSRFLGLDLGFGGGLKVITGTMVTNSITPTAAGGMPIKVLFLMGQGVSARRATTLISLQTAEDALALSALTAVCVGVSGFQLIDFLGQQPGLLVRIEANLAIAGGTAAVLVAGLAGLIAALRAGLFGRAVQSRVLHFGARARSFGAQVISDWLGVVRRGKAVALAGLVLALGQWAARFSIAGIVLAAVGEAWHPALYWLLQYMVQSISSVVPTPGGAGGAEAGFLLLFAPFVTPGALIPAMSLWRLIFYYLPLTTAALLFFLLHRSGARGRRGREHIAESPAASISPHSHPAE
jgi:glycosyltransferase 2 family protein